MRISIMTVLACVVLTGSVQAGMMRFGGERGGFGHRHGGPGMGSFFDTDTIQGRFEDRYTDIQSEYDDGLASIEDYYVSDDYADVVDDMETLTNRYDKFLDHVQGTIDWLDLAIARAENEITFLDDLLTKYQENENLSEDRLARIEDWVTSIQEMLTTKVDSMTEKQTSLTDSLAGYVTFGEEMDTYLDTIVTAGGGTGSSDTSDTDEGTSDDSTSDTTVATVALSVAPAVRIMVAVMAEPAELPISTITVPEPTPVTLMAGVLALAAGFMRSARQ